LLTGVLFPLLLAPARLAFPFQADGSLVSRHGRVVGSLLLAQDFREPGYFHPRPSAAGDNGFDPLASGGSNLGPGNPKLRDDLRTRAERYRSVNGLAADTLIPIDAVTCSGSGLDPHISPANADLQAPRVARERGLSEETVRRLIADHTHGPQFGFLGRPRVFVLALNLALDETAARP
jgi:K+-transporting ATPase ATPase C chain